MSFKFPTQFLDQIRAKVSLSAIVSRRTKLTRAGKLFKGPCPFHREKSPSFVVYEDQGTYHCFGCGAHGDAITFLIEQENYGFLEAVKILASQAGLTVPELKRSLESEKPNLPLIECLEAATQWFEQQLYQSRGMIAQKYLKNRNFDPHIIKRFRLGYAPSGNGLQNHLIKLGFELETLLAVDLVTAQEDSSEHYDRFRDRLMFPIWDKQGRVIGFGGRTLNHKEPKYLNSRETVLFSKGHELYGYHFARKSDFKQTFLIVCEGYTDVLALHQMGYTGAVASLGTALTEHQIALLWRLNPHPLLCFDGDQAGQKAAYRAAERSLSILRAEVSLNFVAMPSGDDPASLLEKNQQNSLKTIFQRKQSLSELLWSREIFGKTFNDPNQRATLDKKLQSYIQQIQDITTKTHYRSFFKEQMFAHFRTHGTKKFAKAWHRPRMDIIKLQYEVLILTIVNHPKIWHEVFEHFEKLEIGYPELSHFQHQLIDAFNCESCLDFDGLNTHLKSIGFESLIKNLLNSVELHASFALSEAPDSEALQGWWRTWHLQCQKTEEAEQIHALSQTLMQDMSAETWQQLQKLKKNNQALNRCTFYDDLES